MELNAAARVGMLVVVALILMGLVIVQIGHIGPESGLRYNVVFDNVQGLQVRAPVHLSGVKIGYVAELQLNSQNRVEVAVQINREDARLFSSDYFTYTIASNLLGDKWLEIKPGPVPEGVKPINPGDRVLGTTPISFDDLAQEGSEVLKELQGSVLALNEIIGDSTFQKDIKVTMTNFRDISGNLKGASVDARNLVHDLSGRVTVLAGSLERVVSHVDQTVMTLQADSQAIGASLRGTTDTVNHLVAANSGNLDTIVLNLRQMSSSLKNTAAAVESIAGDENVRTDVVAIANNIRKVSEEVAQIAGDIRSVTGDPQVQEDIKVTVGNVREASDSAKRVVNKVEGVVDNVTGIGSGSGISGRRRFVEGDVSMEWNTDNGKFSPNVSAMLFPYGGPITAKIGLDSVGYENLLNLQLGKTWDDWRLRGGIIRSKVGVGADAWLFDKRFEANLDVYDPRDVKVDVLGKVLLPKDFYIYGGMRDVTDSHNSSPVVGAGKRF